MKWYESAECRGESANLFFEVDTLPPEDVVYVVSLCERCVVSEECLFYAYSSKSTHIDSIWGGVLFRNGVERDPMTLITENT